MGCDGYLAVGPPLEVMLFPVQRPGDYITAEWELDFFILPISFFFLGGGGVSKFHHILTKKKDIAAA